MNKVISKILEDSQEIRESFFEKNWENIERIVSIVVDTFTNRRKLLICGNGGSAADSQHIVAEFVNKFKIERDPLSAISLTTDTSVITSIGNDYGYNEIFSRQIKAIGKRGDRLILISTSGNSWNLVAASHTARKMGIHTIGFLGGDGGRLIKFVDDSLIVESYNTPRIQEIHILIGHIICELVEKQVKNENENENSESKRKDKIYYIETDTGCGLRLAKSKEHAWRNLLKNEGNNHSRLVRLASKDDINNVESMGGYSPSLEEL